MNTADDILNVLEKWAAEKRPVAPDAYIEAAMKLNSLQGFEDDKLMLFEQRVAKMRVTLLDEGMTATAARMRVEASDEYAAARYQKAKIERIKETIRLSKLRGRMASDEMRNQ